VQELNAPGVMQQRFAELSRGERAPDRRHAFVNTTSSFFIPSSRFLKHDNGGRRQLGAAADAFTRN
jgi:hypothetical protein